MCVCERERERESVCTFPSILRSSSNTGIVVRRLMTNPAMKVCTVEPYLICYNVHNAKVLANIKIIWQFQLKTVINL